MCGAPALSTKRLGIVCTLAAGHGPPCDHRTANERRVARHGALSSAPPASPPRPGQCDDDREPGTEASYLRIDNEALRARLRCMEAILVAAGLNVPSDTEPPSAGERDTDEGPDIESFRREMAMHWSPPPEAPHG